MPSRSSQPWPGQNEQKPSSGDEKMSVDAEYSTLPEVVPEQPLLASHQHLQQHTSGYHSSNPFLHPNNTGSSFTTPLVSPITPESTAASIGGIGHRPIPPTPWSPGSFETLNPVSLSSSQPPLKPPPSYEPSPNSSQIPLASTGWGTSPGAGPGPGHPGMTTANGPPPGPGVSGQLGPPPGGIGPVAAARRRRRRRMWILGTICCVLLLCIIAAVVGILLGVVHIQFRSNDGKGINVGN